MLAAARAPAPGGPQAEPGQIAFSSDRSGQWRIWVMDADGTGMRQLSEGEPEDSDVDPCFSPDATAVLFTSTRGGKSGVWRMAPDGTGPERICDGDQAEWSPDGTRIAFRREEALYVRHLESGEERRISPDGWPHCSGPAWSPDGESIAFACRWDAGNALFLTTPGGGEPVRVYDEKPACEPHWSPDGERLVYETETHICTIRPDGTENRLVTYFGGVQRYGRFSPDGTQIVFCQGASERGPWELYVIPAPGGAPRRLTEGGSDMYPDWH
jgi:TolB protein